MADPKAEVVYKGKHGPSDGVLFDILREDRAVSDYARKRAIDEPYKQRDREHQQSLQLEIERMRQDFANKKIEEQRLYEQGQNQQSNNALGTLAEGQARAGVSLPGFVNRTPGGDMEVGQATGQPHVADDTYTANPAVFNSSRPGVVEQLLGKAIDQHFATTKDVSHQNQLATKEALNRQLNIMSEQDTKAANEMHNYLTANMPDSPYIPLIEGYINPDQPGRRDSWTRLSGDLAKIIEQDRMLSARSKETDKRKFEYTRTLTQLRIEGAKSVAAIGKSGKIAASGMKELMDKARNARAQQARVMSDMRLQQSIIEQSTGPRAEAARLRLDELTGLHDQFAEMANEYSVAIDKYNNRVEPGVTPPADKQAQATFMQGLMQKKEYEYARGQYSKLKPEHQSKIKQEMDTKFKSVKP